MAFFKEWKDDRNAMAWEARLNWTAGLLAILVLAFNLNNPTLGLPATLMAFFALTRGALGLLELTKENHPILSVASFGSQSRMLLGGGVAIVATFLLAGQLHLSIMPGSLSMINLAPGISVDSSMLFVVFLSPVIEEFFFRGLLFYTFMKIPFIPYMRNGWFNAVLVSVVFAWFHYVAYSADTAQMFAAFVISMLWLTANQYFGTLAFSMSSHLCWNWFAFFRTR